MANDSTPLLVLLHAFPLDSRMWEMQLQIAPSRTVAPTLYPYGASLEDWASRVLDTVGDGPLVVVGSSMGGSCAIEIAKQSPERVAAIVTVGTKAGHDPDPELRDSTVATLSEQGAIGLWPLISECLIGKQADESVVERIQRLMLEQNLEDLIRAVRAFHSRADLTDVVARWQKPFVAICGDCDRVVTEEKTATLAASAPNGHMRVMRGCGHYMNMEKPIEFNQIIEDVLRSVAG